MTARLDAENTPHLSAAEDARVRVFGLHKRVSRIFDDSDGIRAGFVILGIMVAGLGLLGLIIVGLAIWLPRWLHP